MHDGPFLGNHGMLYPTPTAHVMVKPMTHLTHGPGAMIPELITDLQYLTLTIECSQKMCRKCPAKIHLFPKNACLKSFKSHFNRKFKIAGRK